MPTINKIFHEFVSARDKLASLDGELAEARTTIRRTAFQERRKLSAQEINQLKEIAATRGELTDALERLALETLASLDAADNLDLLLQEVNSIIEQIDGDLENLGRIDAHAQSAKKVGQQLATVAAALVDLT